MSDSESDYDAPAMEEEDGGASGGEDEVQRPRAPIVKTINLNPFDGKNQCRVPVHLEFTIDPSSKLDLVPKWDVGESIRQALKSSNYLTFDRLMNKNLRIPYERLKEMQFFLCGIEILHSESTFPYALKLYFDMPSRVQYNFAEDPAMRPVFDTPNKYPRKLNRANYIINAGANFTGNQLIYKADVSQQESRKIDIIGGVVAKMNELWGNIGSITQDRIMGPIYIVSADTSGYKIAESLDAGLQAEERKKGIQGPPRISLIGGLDNHVKLCVGLKEQVEKFLEAQRESMLTPFNVNGTVEVILSRVGIPLPSERLPQDYFSRVLKNSPLYPETQESKDMLSGKRCVVVDACIILGIPTQDIST